MGFLFRRAPGGATRIHPGIAAPVDRLLAARGPARCLLAVEVLQKLTASPAGIPEAWERIELPLVQDLPDCPPDAKVALRRALEDCSGACRNRDVARRIMVVRDSLVA